MKHHVTYDQYMVEACSRHGEHLAVVELALGSRLCARSPDIVLRSSWLLAELNPAVDALHGNLARNAGQPDHLIQSLCLYHTPFVVGDPDVLVHLWPVLRHNQILLQ